VPGQNPYLLILPFLLMGLAVFAILLTAVFLLLWPYRRDPTLPDSSSLEPDDPLNNLSPAEAGCLAAPGCRVRWSQALGCLLDLSASGFVTVQAYDRKSSQGTGPDFQVSLVQTPAGRQPFKRALLEVLFLGEAGAQEGVSLEQVASRFAARSRRFEEPLLQALRRKALIDPDREQTFKYLHRLAYSAALLGVFGLAAGLWLASVTGWWASLLIAVGFLAGGLVAYLQAGSFTICSRLGSQSAERWSGYVAALTQAGLPQALEEAQESRQLAYLAAFDQLGTWMGQLQPDSLPTPPAWFQTSLAEEQARRSFIKFLAAATELSGERPGIQRES
jgi:hypothetical protein